MGSLVCCEGMQVFISVRFQAEIDFFSNQNGDKCDIYHYIVENTDVTEKK